METYDIRPNLKAEILRMHKMKLSVPEISLALCVSAEKIKEILNNKI